MSRSPAERPTLWIIAGANGSGKSSAYGMLHVADPLGAVWIINPDELTARIRDQEGFSQEAANVAAVERIEAWLYASVEVHQNIGVETVLSTDKYHRLVETAKARGFQIRLIYVFLATAGLNVERVRIRVSKGGHDVPEDKIRKRRERSLEQFGWFLREADRTDVFDNSGAEPKLVLTRTLDGVEIHGPLPSQIEAAVSALARPDTPRP